MSPEVSVIMATYEGIRFVEAAIASIVAQSGVRFELLVCDDGSTDGTRELLARLPGVTRVLHTERVGVSAARNAAAAVARGRTLAFLDQDDLFLPGRLAATMAVLEARPELGFVYADAQLIDAAGREHGPRSAHLDCREGHIFAHLLTGNCVPIETLTLSRARFEAVGGFDEQLRYLEDLELCLRVAQHHPVAFLPTCLAAYRIHGTNLTYQKRALLVEFHDLLRRWSQQEELAPNQRELAAGEAARRGAEAAWAALREGDLPAARTLLHKAGPGGPRSWRWRVQAGLAVLQALPRPWRERLLRAWPSRALYGVPAASATES